MDYTPDQIAKKITSFLEENGQHIINPKGAGGGTLEEYPFGLMPANRGGVVLMLSVTRETADKKRLAALKKQLLTDGVKLLTGAASGRPADVLVVLLDPKTLGEDFVREGARRTVAAVQKLKFEPARRCALCGGENCDILAEFGGGYRPMHRACADAPAEAIRKNPVLNPPSSWAKGLAGALLGLVAGLAVMALVSALMGAGAVSFPFLLLPGFLFLGYKLLGKRFTPTGFWVLLACMAAGLPLALTELGACIYMQQNDLAFTQALQAAAALISNPGNLLSLLNISWLYLLCAGLLLWNVWKAAHSLSDKNIARAVSGIDATASTYDLAHTAHLE